MTQGMSRAELQSLPAVVDLATAARALRLGRALAYRLAAAGDFPVRVFKIADRYRVSTADLLALIDGAAQPHHDAGRSDGADDQ